MYDDKTGVSIRRHHREIMGSVPHPHKALDNSTDTEDVKTRSRISVEV